MRIILVEDEVKLARVLSHGLIQKGYAVDVVNDGIKALNRISLNHIDYDLIILDLTLPGMDGTTITKTIRERNITTPILILTARDETTTKIDLLLSGADDYLVKPFSFDELCARIQTLLRRPTEMIPIVLKVADIELNSAEHKVRKADELLPLTLKEFVLLEYFMRNPNKVINREELLSHLWDFNYTSFSNVVDVHIKNLRKKLDSVGDKNLLETVRGRGYKLKS
jgi:two-component system, OmpR family, copper resistance phosphate regulon response regulator CusR